MQWNLNVVVRLMTMLVFGVPHIHWRRIKVQVETLQDSQIKHEHVQIVCMIISRLIGLFSRLGIGLVDWYLSVVD